MSIYEAISKRIKTVGVVNLSKETGIDRAFLSRIASRKQVPSKEVAKVFGYERIKHYTFRLIKE